MNQEINEVVDGIDNNIKLLEEAKEINFTDVKTLLIMVFGTLKDLFERFQCVFEKVEKVNKLEGSIIKGEIITRNFSEEAGRLYQ